MPPPKHMQTRLSFKLSYKLPCTASHMCPLATTLTPTSPSAKQTYQSYQSAPLHWRAISQPNFSSEDISYSFIPQAGIHDLSLIGYHAKVQTDHRLQSQAAHSSSSASSSSASASWRVA